LNSSFNIHHSSFPLPWLCADLPRQDYQNTWDFQHRLVEARAAGTLANDVVLLVEHEPVFTLGRRGGTENLNVSADFLRRSGIPVVHVERGGDVTYHGPGQLVAYPIVSLKAAHIRVVDFVAALEEIMIRVATHWGVSAGRDPRNRGVWIGDNKLGSVGISVRRGVSYHGFAFNVCPSFEHFGWIHPCGLKGVGIATLQKEAGREIPMHEVRDVARREFESVFGVQMQRVEWERIGLSADHAD
jgi:lipoate-protein ligase B